jgi:hypothetical protein
MLTQRAVRVAGIVAAVLILGLALGGQVFAPPVPPPAPTIDDLVGTWNYTLRWTEYNLTSGLKERDSQKGMCTITKTGPTTVNMEFTIDSSPWDTPARYSGGVLMTGGADNAVLATQSWTEYFPIRGRPGHLTAKGQYIDYGPTYLESGTMSLKQLQP